MSNKIKIKMLVSKPESKPESKPNPMILIDSSYFSFYRFYATKSWYKRAYPDEPLDQNWLQNYKFMQMYIAKYKEHMQKIAMHLSVSLEDLIFVRDSPHENLWRTKLFPGYKSHRQGDPEGDDKKFGPGQVIKFSNDNILSPHSISQDKMPVKVLRIPGAEADDIIAVLARHHIKRRGDVWIIANDTDFYQLLSTESSHHGNIKIYTLGPRYSLISIPLPDPLYLETKILTGDKTDSISPIFSGCGPVTARELLQDPSKLSCIFANHPDAHTQYILNRTLIDFREIPSHIYENIITAFSKENEHLMPGV